MTGDVFPTFRLTVHALRAHIDRMLQEHGLRLGQYQLLRALWEHDGLTPRELAELIGVEMPTVTRTVQRMLRDGLVRREANPNDARSVHIYLTQKGQEVRSLVERIVDAGTTKALAGFSDHDRAELASYLGRILNNLSP